MATKSSKKWLTVTITCPEKIVEAAADQMGVMSGVGVDIQPVNSSNKQMITGFFALDENNSDSDIENATNEILQKVTGELEKLFAIYNLILHEPKTTIIDDEDWSTS